MSTVKGDGFVCGVVEIFVADDAVPLDVGLISRHVLYSFQYLLGSLVRPNVFLSCDLRGRGDSNAPSFVLHDLLECPVQGLAPGSIRLGLELPAVSAPSANPVSTVPHGVVLILVFFERDEIVIGWGCEFYLVDQEKKAL